MQHKIKLLILLLVTSAVICLLHYGTAQALHKKKVLYVDSYHPELLWVQEITEGILRELNITLNKDGSLNDSKSHVQLKIVHMDTKRNTSEEFKKKAALRVKHVIDSWRPDVVIASDDNASKYLIAPYYKNSRLPFVFCGINWDASVYGFPYNNVTGMVEVGLIEPMMRVLKLYSRGERIGFLGMDVISDRKDARAYRDIFGLDLNEKYVSNFEEWKRSYLDLQNEADILILHNPTGMSDWDMENANDFVDKNTRIPSGTVNKAITSGTLLGYIKKGAEQGSWAAKTALEILDGKSPEDIPIVKNKKASIYLNMRIASELEIMFPAKLIKYSTLVK